MAVTVSKLSPSPDTVWGNLRVKFRTVAFDSSYPTGGEPLAASDFGLRRIHQLLVENAAGYVFEYDHTNAKLKAYVTAAHTHTENTAAAYTQNATTAASTAAALAEAANTTNLSSLTGVRVMAIGV